MRIKIDLQGINNNIQYIPINYQYYISSWIYKIIETADTQYAEWLHNKGYGEGTKHFKMFCFSRLNLPYKKYKIEGDLFKLFTPNMSFKVSFRVEKAVESFVSGLFQNQRLEIATPKLKSSFLVKNIQVIKEPDFKTCMTYKTISPILLSKGNKTGSATYLAPNHEEYEVFLAKNLINKLKALGNKAEISEKDIHFRLLGAFKKNGVTIKENHYQRTKVIAYLFTFELDAPLEIHRLAYSVGFGNLSSQGFGCVEEVR